MSFASFPDVNGKTCVSDALTGIGVSASSVEANVIIMVDGVVYPSVAVDNGNGIWAVGAYLEGLSEGSHVWNVGAWDQVGNITTSDVYAFTVSAGN